jgi:5-methylcytosine-specific restriction endonuclease McrA
MKKPTYAGLKRKLDAAWSELVRRRDADRNGNVSCVTCGRVDHWKSMQNGHFIPRHYLAGRWLDENCNVQCPSCNVFRRGAYPEYADYLHRTFGASRIGELIQLKREKVKYTRADLEEMLEKVRGQLEALT